VYKKGKKTIIQQITMSFELYFVTLDLSQGYYLSIIILLFYTPKGSQSIVVNQDLLDSPTFSLFVVLQDLARLLLCLSESMDKPARFLIYYWIVTMLSVFLLIANFNNEWETQLA